jgi:hypothetical protein
MKKEKSYFLLLARRSEVKASSFAIIKSHFIPAHPTNLYPLGFISYKITQEGAVLDNVKLAYFEVLFKCFLTRAFLLDILVNNFTFLTLSFR